MITVNYTSLKDLQNKAKELGAKVSREPNGYSFWGYHFNTEFHFFKK